VREPDCVICRGPTNVIGELDAVWITAPTMAPLPGYVCVVSKRHVDEPFELDDAASFTFWREAMAVAKALHARLRPRKMNYEIHGNSIPHLHMHLFPRYEGDPFAGRPIDASRTVFERGRDELRDLGRYLATESAR
jgi:diadenosine tetraphosphate (Ap4A) HIT family hydrolase